MKRLSYYTTRDLFPGGFFYLAIAILILSFGFIILSQSVWDYDFWWHIATGRYIVETGHLPYTDPFSFTSALPENNNFYPEREQFILTQYWLAQILMYFLYQVFGPAGIIILRGFLLLSVMYLIYRSLKSRGAIPYVIYLALVLAAYNLIRFSGDRPVLFTITLTAACFVIIDDYMHRRSRLFYLLPVLMLLWANLHGGFIVGVAMILAFMTTELVKVVMGRSAFSNKEKKIFFIVSLISIGASCLNPNGFLAFQIALSSKYAPFYEGIEEYASPFFLARNQLMPADYGFFVALLLFPLILILRNRKFNVTHLILLLAFAVAGCSAGRYTVYFGVIASLVLGNELSLWLKEHGEKFLLERKSLNIAISSIMLVSSALYCWGMVNPNVLNMRESRWTVSKKAADFIEKNNIKGNVLNDMANGGYFAWRLYPRLKNFIDTRGLNYTVMREYSWIATATESVYTPTLPAGKVPIWKRLIEHYKINVIVFNPLGVYGDIIRIIPKLLDDDQWVPVSVDVMAIVFVKNVPENRDVIEKYRKPKDDVYNMAIMRAIIAGQHYKDNPRYLVSLAEIFLKMGKKDDAIKAYRYAMQRMPGDNSLKERLEELLKEKQEVKN